MASTSTTSTVFVGSSYDLDDLSAAGISTALLADGDVSFYGHMSGLITAYIDGTEKQTVSTWAGTGAGVVELNEDPANAVMRVSITNTSSSSIIIPVGTLVSSARGVQFQIELQPDIAQYWVQGSGGLGEFVIPAGASISVLAQAVQDGPSGNLADNSVTQIGITGATITASTLDTAADQWSGGTLTLKNTGTTSTIIYTSMTVTGSNGVTYEVAVNSAVSGFVATDADSSSGYYVLAAGATITVPIASVVTTTATTAAGIMQQELAANAAANSITGLGTLPSGVTIVSSSAMVTEGQTSASGSGVVSTLGNTGILTDANNQLFTTDQGYTPTEADVDTYNETIWSAQDLANWEAYVNNARAQGYLNLAPMMAEYEEGDFATAAATQYIRAAALYSGGIAFDLPPSFFLNRDAAFQASTEAEIKWATANGLRSSITLSPASADDPNFLADTEKLVAMLEAAGAMPTQFVVKDGGVTGTATIYSSDPNSLNSVAAWLASLTLTPSNSESGLETRGTSSRPDDLMTGVAPSESLVGGSAIDPYSIAQLFAETTTTTGTVTVTLSSASLGKLVAASGLGNVSQNGTVFTASGTMAQMTAALEAMAFIATTGVVGSGTLSISITDAVGTITGQTAIAVDNLLSLSGVQSSGSLSAPSLVDRAVVLSSGNASTQLTATVTLSNASLASFWNVSGGTVSADGTTLTLVGTAATLQTELRQVATVPQVGASGTEIETVSVTDGTQTVSATTTLAMTVTNRPTAGGVPTAMLVGSSGKNLPFADILLSDTRSPSDQFSVGVTLPSGAAKLVAGAGGTVSSDGLSFSFTGTAAQIQVALRGLSVSVPAGVAAGTTEALTLNFHGYGTHVTVLTLGSTDTVFVGAPDSTESGYSSSFVSSSLVSSGTVGLDEDYGGIVPTVSSGGGTALSTEWSGTAAGVFTETATSLVAQQAVIIKNTSSASVTIPVGTIVSTASGVQFQVVQSSTATTSSFVVAAGASITLTVEALQTSYTGNVAANAITTISGISGVSITASSASVLAIEEAGGTVTLTNTGTTTVNIFEGTVLTNSTGTYQIGNTPTANGYVAFLADNSDGYYALAPGASTTVAVYGTNALSGTAANQLTQIAAQTTTATNTLTSTALPTGVTITASSAITLTGPTTAAAAVTWGSTGAGTGVLTDYGFGRLVENSGFPSTEASLFLPLSTTVTTADLGEMEAYVNTLRGLGVLNVSIAVSGIQDFSSSAATANLRTAALYGGGIDIDATPASILAGGTTALTAIEDDIKWATQNGLRSTLTLRAYGDTTFLDETKTLMADLQAAGALPSQVLVLGSPTSTTVASSELAPAVAAYVATLGLTPSASESGLETTGSTVDDVMTGVQASETVTGTAAIAPYAVAQVYAESATTMLTATVALSSTVLGVLSLSGTTTATSTVSTDGSTITLVGTQAQIDASLAAIRYTPASGATGNAVLNLSITDTDGTITGQTKLTVGNPAVAVSVSVSATSSTTAATTATTTSSSTVTITTGSTSDALRATTGGTVTGNSFTVSGTAAADAKALAGLMVTPANGKVANLHITLGGAGLSFTDTNPGNDLITSAGGELIQTSGGIDTVAAGAGDTISAGSGSVFASGTQSFRFIGGSSTGDTVTGGAGGGVFTAGTGGNSVLTAGTGVTTLNAAGANDTLTGGGASVLNGAANLATNIFASGGDTVNGAVGSIIHGPHGGTKAAIINLGAGGETLIGDTGSMSVAGGAGVSHIQLASGNATITGGAGAENIAVDGATHSTLIDGAGAEVITMSKGLSAGAVLTLSGFSATKDQVVLSGYGTATTGKGAAYTESTVSGGTMLTLSDGATITLLGVSNLSASAVVLH